MPPEVPPQTIGSPLLYGLFLVLVLGMLALDLGVFHRKSHVVTLKEAAGWSVVWVALAAIFGGWLWSYAGPERGLEFATGYLIEKALAVDNIFIFCIIFSAFAVPPAYQHRVLFWGVLGALIMRGAFIAVGAALLERFHWTIYLFGAILILTGVKLLIQRDSTPDVQNNILVRAFRRFFPVTTEYHGDAFTVVKDGTRFATPLLLALVAVEFTDLVFAVDSIPAIFAVTSDPFIVFTSNVFAILGLRSLYFLLAGVLDKFHKLKIGLAFVLLFVGATMTFIEFFKVPVGLSLGIIAAILGGSIVWSLMTPPPAKPTPTPGAGAAG